ncbi:hypothetical protein [Aquabacterium sp.]|uniref:hypothetical protein n=1 Tax=Aquabacterium sp. TaxID=1872578 RepID=UPI00403769D6
MSAEAYTVLDGDTVLCIFGVAERGPWGVPWMLSTSDLKSLHMKAGITEARRTLDRWLSTYGRLFNLVHERNEQPKRWLRWMGFAIDSNVTFTHPKTGEQFRTFTMMKDKHV